MRPERLTAVAHDSLTFPVLDNGPLDGETVLLLHGFPQTATAWSPVTERLNAAGYRTIAPTLRGYSARARPRGRASYRAGKLVGDVVALIDAIDSGPVHVVGHDWGAAAAWFSAGSRPDLVRSLTVVGVPHYLALLSGMLRSDQLRRSYYFGLFQLPVLPELLIRSFPAAFAKRLAASGLSDTAVAEVERQVIAAGSLTSALNWYRGLVVSSQRTMSTPTSVPTTMVWGDADTLFNRTSIEGTAAHVTGPYRLEVIPGAGHWIPEQHPDALVRVLLETGLRS